MSKFLNISTDNTLGGSSASDDTVASQKAVKDYVDNLPGLTIDQTYDGTSTNAQSGVAVAQALAGKADTDLSNLTSTGKSYASGLGMPSSRYINLTVGASGATYTAPANGEFNSQVRLASSGQGAVLQNTTTDVITRAYAAASNQLVATFILARKGDIINYQYGAEATTNPYNTLRFHYSEGEI